MDKKDALAVAAGRAASAEEVQAATCGGTQAATPATGTGKARGYYFNQDWSIEDTAFSYTENGVGKTSWAVPGMITLSEVRKEKKVRALYGTYADQPVEITLPNYIE